MPDYATVEADVRAELVDVAELLAEASTRTRALADLPLPAMPAAMAALAADVGAVLDRLAGGEDQ